MRLRLGVYTLGVYSLGLPILDLEILRLRLGLDWDEIEIGSLHSGSLQCRATDLLNLDTHLPGNLLPGDLHSGDLESWATDLGSGMHLPGSLQSEGLQSRPADFRRMWVGGRAGGRGNGYN